MCVCVSVCVCVLVVVVSVDKIARISFWGYPSLVESRKIQMETETQFPVRGIQAPNSLQLTIYASLL